MMSTKCRDTIEESTQTPSSPPPSWSSSAGDDRLLTQTRPPPADTDETATNIANNTNSTTATPANAHLPSSKTIVSPAAAAAAAAAPAPASVIIAKHSRSSATPAKRTAHIDPMECNNLAAAAAAASNNSSSRLGATTYNDFDEDDHHNYSTHHRHMHGGGNSDAASAAAVSSYVTPTSSSSSSSSSVSSAVLTTMAAKSLRSGIDGDCRGSAIACIEKVEIFLETPVADDDGGAVGAAQSATADGTSFAAAAAERLLLADGGGNSGLSAVKPKCLNDEFYSADDGSEADEDEFEEDDDEQQQSHGPTDKAARVARGVGTSPAQQQFASSPFRKNAHAFAAAANEAASPRMMMLIDDDVGAAAAAVAAAPQSPPTFDDASPKSATQEADDAQLLLLHDDDDDDHQRDLAGVVDEVNDVIAMDAIERLDVEEEHRLTGSGGLVRCRRTPVAGAANDSAHEERIPMQLINVYVKKSEIDDEVFKDLRFSRSSPRLATANTIANPEATAGQQAAAPVKLATTPTTSRSKLLRFGVPHKSVASAKINLSETLDKASGPSGSFYGGVGDPAMHSAAPAVADICDDESQPGLVVDPSAIVAGIMTCTDAAAAAASAARSNTAAHSITCTFRRRSSSSPRAVAAANASVSRTPVLVPKMDEEEESTADEFPPPLPAPPLANEVVDVEAVAVLPAVLPEDELDLSCVLEEDEMEDEDDDDEEEEEEEEEDEDDDDDDDEEEEETEEGAMESDGVHVRFAAAVDEDEPNDGDDNDDRDDNRNDNRDDNDLVRAEAEISPRNDDAANRIRSRYRNGVPVGGNDPNGAAAGVGAANNIAHIPVPHVEFPAGVAEVARSMFMELADNDEYEEEAWTDCVEAPEDDEICTCRDYSDEECMTGSEDERDDNHDDDAPNCGTAVLISGSTPRTANSSSCAGNRKRRLTDCRADSPGDASAAVGAAGAAGSDTDSATTPGKRRRLHMDPLHTSTPSSNVTLSGAPAFHGSQLVRTPRSLLIPTRDNPPPELCQWLVQFQRWTNAERMLATDRLIDICEPTQVRHMMKVIEPQFQRDFISLLPKELALGVLSFLEPEDLLRAAQTCRSWRFLCDDNLLWKDKCRRISIVAEPNMDRPRRGRAGNMPPISSPWKAAYMRQTIIELNWRSRPIREAKTLKGHDDHVITCLQFCGNRIVSGSDDNTLKVWSAITGKCLRTLVGHTGGVWSSQMAGSIIISGSTDRTLKVWNADSGQCTHTLFGHTSTVRCMHLHGSKVVSGSRDATLRVWDILAGKCLHILVGHLAAVRCVQYDGRLVVSGAYDYMVKVWNPERQECLHTLQGHTNRVYSLQFDGVHVVSGSLDTSIRVWDAETGNCKHTLMGHQSLTSGMELRQNILVSGNADSTVKVWDITNGQCLQTLSGPFKHQSAVTCLQFNARFVVTSSDDGTVKLWDVRTGQFIRNLVALDSGGSGGVVWRIRANDTKLICAVGSRNGTEETKLMVLDFDVEGACLKCS